MTFMTRNGPTTRALDYTQTGDSPTQLWNLTNTIGGSLQEIGISNQDLPGERCNQPVYRAMFGFWMFLTGFPALTCPEILNSFIGPVFWKHLLLDGKLFTWFLPTLKGFWGGAGRESLELSQVIPKARTVPLDLFWKTVSLCVFCDIFAFPIDWHRLTPTQSTLGTATEVSSSRKWWGSESQATK